MAFAAPLVATVTSGGSPASGVSVTFTAPATGASGTFATTTPGATDTETTNSSGVATSQMFAANTTAGGYTVTAAATGATATASFSLSNTAGAAATLTATSGAGQSATVSTAFANPLVATVTDADNNPVSGVSVTFTAPASGASGLFATATPAVTDTETTGSNGQATSQAFTANATAGGPYNVVATSGTLTPVNFAETNTPAVVAGSNTYVFYASGQEAPNSLNGGFVVYYAIAGAVTLDASGDVLGGEQDYNDGIGNTSPGEPNTPDTIAPATAALVAVDANAGLYTLTLTSSNTNVGVGGVETFAIQFVNSNHALISQFDGSATSSGSLDLQTLANANGNFAFAISGVNPNYDSVAFGGVYNASGNSVAGTIDVNDDDGGVLIGSTFNASTGTTDLYGRTVVTGVTNPAFGSAITFVSYEVGSEVLRIIDVDNGTTTGTTMDSAVGSAYGQGSATFTNATFPSPTSANGVFTLLGQWSESYATLGGFGTDSSGHITGGDADDNELDNTVQVETSSIATSTYDLVSSGINGYGSINLNWNGVTPAPDVTTLGLYMVDPTLNINDPNNTTSVDVGGALVVDLDAALPGGIGVITPQQTSGSFSGTYVAGFQDFNTISSCSACEFDMISQGTMNSTSTPALSLTGADSDPFGTLTGTPGESTGDTFTSTPDNVSSGVYSMSQFNSTPNPLNGTINGASGLLDVDIYQASGTTLYWLNWDGNSVFLGSIVAQGSLTGVPGDRKPAAKTQPKQNIKPIKGLGGTLR